MKNYYERIMLKIHYCMNDDCTTNKQKLERLKDILEVTRNLNEIGKLTLAQYSTIFNIIVENMWECI